MTKEVFGMRKSIGKAQGMALLIFVNVMWGLSFIFSKTALSEGMPSMTLAFWRYVMTAVIMVPLCIRLEGGIRLREWAPRAFATTMLGITVYYFFEYNGLRRTTASAASLILALVPVMTLLARVVLARVRISPLRWLCVLLSLLGAYWVIRADSGEDAGTLAGNLLMIGACLCWTGYILVSPRLMAACSPTRVTAWQSVCAVITLLPFSLGERGAWVAVSAKAWLCVFLLAAVCSALCYLLYGVAIRACDPLTVSLSININPVAACIGGALLLHESLTGMQLLGGALILLSMIVDTLETSGAFRAKRG